MKILFLGVPTTVRHTFVRLALLALVLIPTWAPAQTIDESLLKGLQWRNLGPFRGGRVSAVAGAIGDAGTFYMGLPQGGVWKTTSAGQTWVPIFDSVKDTAAIGSIAVSASDPNTIYVGTGEIPQNGIGYGVYKSTDGGKSWQHLGLEDTQIIPAVLVDPKDPNLVLVASRGSFTTKEQRGVYRSTDGGKTWERTLFIDKDTGINHIASAFDHPEIVYAASRDGRNTESKCKIYRSADEGKTWTPTPSKGLPRLVNRYTLAVAQGTDAKRVYLVGTFGLYRSDDGGDTWRRMAEDDKRIRNGQGNYSSGVFVDSQNPDIVYVVATCLYRSTDGGITFEGFKGAPGGDDPHFMWIDPTNGKRMLYGGDQGATVSLDGGAHWGSWYNQPSAQVYHVTTDNQYPYWVYATQQDSGVVGTASRGNFGQIGPFDWIAHPGFEFGFVAIDPLNPKISYSLSPSLGVGRTQYPSGQWIEAGPAADPDDALRFTIMLPLYFSPTNPRELMAGYQYLYSTTDGGQHWKKLSPDLATFDVPAKDPKDKPTPNASYITSFSSSSINGKVIWVGTGNGMVQVTQDHGGAWTWTKEGLPSPSTATVQCIEASHHDLGTAYVVFGTFPGKPSVYRTRDFGKTWNEIDNGFPTSGPMLSNISFIRCDTKRKGLLFAGSGREMFVSIDDGDHWQPLTLNMPTTIMNDLQVKGDDLVLGTYGRGLWVLDDISPLRQLSQATKDEPAHLFTPAVGVRVRRNVNDSTPMPPEIPHALNPPLGVSIYYSLGSKPSSPITLEIVDKQGNVVRHMSSAEPIPYADPKPEVAPYWIGKRKPMPTEVGLNRVNWNIRYDDPPAFIHDVQDTISAAVGDTPEAVEGPLALPGKYTVRLTVDGKSYEAPLEVVNDPRSPASNSDIAKSHDIEMNLEACVNAGWDSYGQVTAMRASLSDALKSNVKEAADAAKDYDSKLEQIQGKIVYTRRSFQRPNSKSFIDNNIYLLAALSLFSSGDAAPTEQYLALYGGAFYSVVELLDKWRTLNGKPLDDLNAVLRKNGLSAMAAMTVAANPPSPDPRFRRKAGAVGKAAKITIPDEDGDGDDDDNGDSQD